MKKNSDSTEARLLVALQKGLPFVPRPFAAVGRDLGLSEEAVLERVRTLFDSGVARRFGGVFDSASLGYASTLCAADIPAADLDAAAARIAPNPGITHCYEREGRPNLWFTVTAPAPELASELDRIGGMLGAYPILNFPALRKFKVEAVFGQEEQSAAPQTGAPAQRPPLPPLPERERQVVRRLQANIAVSEDPFGVLAGELGYAPAEFLALLTQWKQAGIIRRIGLVLRHRKLGLAANSMCVWPVPADRIEAAGRFMAGNPHVSHCYVRPASEAFPFNLYAMIHAETREKAVSLFERLQAGAGLSGGRMLWSVREFKKSSPVFFQEPPAGKNGPP